jgi:hypothetical protein
VAAQDSCFPALVYNMCYSILFHYAECHYAECHNAECHNAECHNAECHYVVIMLSVVMLSDVAPHFVLVSIIDKQHGALYQ